MIETMCDFIFPYIRKAKEKKTKMIWSHEKEEMLFKLKNKHEKRGNEILLNEEKIKNDKSHSTHKTNINIQNFIHVNTLYTQRHKRINTVMQHFKIHGTAHAVIKVHDAEFAPKYETNMLIFIMVLYDTC